MSAMVAAAAAGRSQVSMFSPFNVVGLACRWKGCSSVQTVQRGQPVCASVALLPSATHCTARCAAQVTQGKHMVDALNRLNITAACVGNHDLGVPARLQCCWCRRCSRRAGGSGATSRLTLPRAPPRRPFPAQTWASPTWRAGSASRTSPGCAPTAVRAHALWSGAQPAPAALRWAHRGGALAA